jgi:hypothetical protein
MQSWQIFLLISASFLASCAHAQTASALIGTWMLTSIVTEDEHGGTEYPFKKGAVGQLIYNADGSMSVIVSQPERPPFASGDMRGGTDAEVRAAFEGFLGYFGTYSVDEKQGFITHHIQGSCLPNWEGHEQIRYYKLEGKQLTLTSPILSLAGKRCKFIVYWERR